MQMVEHSSKQSTRPVLAVGAFIASLLAIPFILFAFLGDGTPSKLPRIDINRAQYEEALATWRAQNIEEYEITTDSQYGLGGRGKLTLRVSMYGDKVEMLFPDHESMSPQTEETVQGLFNQVDHLLTETDQLYKTTPNPVGYIANKITFDNNLGIPTHLQGIPVGRAASDSDWEVKVTDFTVIKRRR